MTETIRTLIYVGIAGVVALVAFLVQPRVVVETGDTIVNQVMFEKFSNPLDAKSLEITSFDDKSAALRSFKVAQENGRWVIPSHAGYPADAETQLRDAAAGLMNLKALDIASKSAADHALYGVVEPSKEKLKVGDQGVGTLVAIQDGKGSDLLRLIIGKPVAGAEGQHFVRKPGQEPVYVCKVGLDKLPLDFDKWIEKDLLKLNALDVAKVTMKDYSILPTPQGLQPFPRMQATVAWNSEKGNWGLEKLTLFSKGGAREAPLGEQEELNEQKLNDLKTALDDLKIVDVSRKPAGLGADLKVSADFAKNEEAQDSLAQLGFYPAMTADEKIEIMSSNGEVLVDMKDGVQYVLRFGNIQGAQKGSEEGKLNRYLFVTAQLSPSALTPPKLEPEAAGPAPTDTPEKPDSAKTEEGACQEDAPKADDEKAAKTPTDEPKSDGKKPEAKNTDADEAEKPADDKTPPAAVDPNQALVDQVRKENQRKLDDFNDKKKKAEIRVAELNARFADWYYVISEDVYKKVHLTRADIIKEGASAKDEGFGVDAFRKLESEGITPPPATPAAPASPGFPGSGFPGGVPNF